MCVRALAFLLVMLCLCGSFANAAQPQEEFDAGPFAGGIADAVWTIIAFVSVLFILWKWPWKWMLASLNARKAHIEKEISDAEKIRKEARDVLTDYQARLADADNQGKKIIEAHTKQAQAQAKDLMAGSRKQIEQMKVKSELDIDRARRIAQQELLARTGDIVSDIGRQILGKAVTTQDNEKLIAEAIQKLKKQAENE